MMTWHSIRSDFRTRMGTLVKDARNRSKFWYWCYTGADGRRLKKSTKETDRRKAKIAGQAIEEAEEALKSGTASEDQLRRIFNDMRERLTGRPVYDPTVRQWIDRWLESEKPAVSENTFCRYSQISGDFLKSLGHLANVRLEILSSDEVLRYRDFLVEEKKVAPQTVNLALKILKRAFKVAIDEGVIGRNPVATVRTIRDREKGEKGTFTPAQVAELVAHAKGDWKGLILAGYYTGGRLSDLVRLKWSNVDIEEKTITFWQKKTEGKSSRPKVKIPIHPQLEEHLLAGPMSDSPNAPVFPELYDQPGSGKSGLSMAFKRIMDGAGIKSEIIRERQGKDGRSVSALTFHSLRHSFTSALANAGVTPEIRQKLTGHADLKSHQIYTHHELQTVRNAIETLGRLPIEERPR